MFHIVVFRTKFWLKWKIYTWTYDLYNHQSRENKLYDLFKTTHVSFWDESKNPVLKNNNISQILATKLQEKFWAEESIRRLNIILESTKKTKIKNIISDTIEILEN
jgi:hypothetical protein